MVGLYETALEALCMRQVDGEAVRPKIIASTATVRRAESQIRALFNRATVDIFPPPGPDRRDSFFARTLPASESPARLYVGIAAQGRSPKVVMLRAYLALLGAAQKYFDRLKVKGQENPADPYMTLVGYFNACASWAEPADRRGRSPQPAGGLRVKEAARRGGGALRQPPDRLRSRRADLPREHGPGGGGEAAPGTAVWAGQSRGRGDRHEHDLGRPRHHPAGPDGRVRPAEDERRVHPGHEPRRPRPRAARAWW